MSTGELLSCPFCSAEPEILSDGRRTWGLVQHNDGCLFPIYPKHEIPETDFAAWNTRAERTCKVVASYDTSGIDSRDSNAEWYFAFSCGCELYWDEPEPPSYCPNCGAKVVSE